MDGGKRWLWGARFVAAVACLLPTASAVADDVPIELQVDLLARVVKFERTFTSNGKAPATVIVVAKPSVTVSTRASAQLTTALKRAGNLAGRPVTVITHSFTKAPALKAVSAGSAIVYLMPGLSDEVKNISEALSGMRVLVVAASGDDVERGAVLGFDLQSARPRIVVNLPKARAQSLDFNSQLLRLAKVIQ